MGRRTTRLAQALLVALALPLLGLGAATSATAGTASATAGTAPASTYATCVYDIGLTIKQGTVIRGSASMTKCAAISRIEIYLQRWRGTYWQTLDHKTRTSTGSTGVSWNCAGAGTYTYRTIVYAYRWDGSASVPAYKISNQPRYTC